MNQMKEIVHRIHAKTEPGNELKSKQSLRLQRPRVKGGIGKGANLDTAARHGRLRTRAQERGL